MQKRKTVAVYTPYLQGFYFGEIVAQLQQFCFLKGYAFSVIKTNSFGEFNSTVHLDHIDYVVILRNAIHSALAQIIKSMGKPTLSIAYDYFPLNIPMVTCDNALGVELAFNHLIKEGHQQFAFVGDLSQYDIRKRYEAFCEQHQINQFTLDEKNIFSVKDSLFSGGYAAARQFHQNNSQATGIICGAGLTSIGFAQQLQHLRGDISGYELVGFDAISLVPVTHPDMTMIDQNFHQLAYKALDVLQAIDAGEKVERHYFIEPKLITAKTNFLQAEDAFLANSTEIAELHNANYMKSVMSNLYEWPKAIVESNLEHLMILAPLFEKYLSNACYGKTAMSKDGKEFIKITQTFGLLETKQISPKETASITLASQYPAPCAGVKNDDLDTSVHLPIIKNGKILSLLSVYGSAQKRQKISSFSAFCTYLDIIGLRLSNQLQALTTETLPTNTTATPQGLIHWNSTNGGTFWDDNALHLLGLTSDLEKNIYRHMDIIDRVSAADESTLRELLIESKNHECCCEIQLKHKNKHYLKYNLISQPNTESTGLNLRIMLSDTGG